MNTPEPGRTSVTPLRTAAHRAASKQRARKPAAGGNDSTARIAAKTTPAGIDAGLGGGLDRQPAGRGGGLDGGDGENVEDVGSQPNGTAASPHSSATTLSTEEQLREMGGRKTRAWLFDTLPNNKKEKEATTSRWVVCGAEIDVRDKPLFLALAKLSRTDCLPFPPSLADEPASKEEVRIVIKGPSLLNGDGDPESHAERSWKAAAFRWDHGVGTDMRRSFQCAYPWGQRSSFRRSLNVSMPGRHLVFQCATACCRSGPTRRSLRTKQTKRLLLMLAFR